MFGLEVSNMTYQEAFNRGTYDAQTNRAPIFRSTRAYGYVASIDDEGADAWDQVDRAAYLAGYAAWQDAHEGAP